MNIINTSKFITCCAILLATSLVAEELDLTGEWTFNDELTEELRPEPKRNRGIGNGLGNVAGGVGRVLIPGGRGSSPDANAVALKHPVILDCVEFTLTKKSNEIEISCANGSHREFFVGKRHGRNTKWKSKLLTESYSSTSRRVRHEFRLDRDDNLVVTVKVQPKGGASQKYIRAFLRKTEDGSEETPEPKEQTATEEAVTAAE